LAFGLHLQKLPSFTHCFSFAKLYLKDKASLEGKKRLKMGRRDFRHREPKKPKKGAKRPPISELLPTPTTVEVIKKGKKEKSTEEEEE
jgi:hypothetical protein